MDKITKEQIDLLIEEYKKIGIDFIPMPFNQIICPHCGLDINDKLDK